MFIPMATGPEPVYQHTIMQWVAAIFIVAAIVGTIYLAVRSYKRARAERQLEKFSSFTFFTLVAWIGAAFIGISVLVYTVAGPTISLFLSDRLGFEYIQPLTLAFSIFLLSIGVFACGGLIVLVTRKPSSKKGKRRQTIAERKAAATKPTGIETFADHNQN